MNALTFHALTGLLLFLSLDFQSLFLTSSSSFSSKVHASELEASSAASVGKQRRGEPQYREKWNDDFTVDWQGGKYDLPLGYIPAGSQRPPGTLLLNMLIKNEREHLDRTLPQWAKVIDYWIIGVDDANTDGSEDVIQKHLGHIPGHIVIVNFDGMGPTWSILVNEGIIHYPEATHGIMSDADFMPLKPESFDKYQLDIRCSKHMYVIWTEDHSSERKMDWIYRNIPGVIIKRRTHQTIEAPPLRGQTVFQTLVDLPIEERAGGYVRTHKTIYFASCT